jgi:hypothetical protein
MVALLGRQLDVEHLEHRFELLDWWRQSGERGSALWPRT